MTTEPLVTVAVLTALVAAVITCLVAFGVDITEDQKTAVLGLVAVVAPFVVAFIVRPKVTPVTEA